MFVSDMAINGYLYIFVFVEKTDMPPVQAVVDEPSPETADSYGSGQGTIYCWCVIIFCYSKMNF